MTSKPDSQLDHQIQNLPLGYSEVLWRQKRYGVTRQDFNAGASTKVLAEALDGSDLISCNYYRLSGQKGSVLKPCEIPKQHVEQFLAEYKLVTP